MFTLAVLVPSYVLVALFLRAFRRARAAESAILLFPNENRKWW